MSFYHVLHNISNNRLKCVLSNQIAGFFDHQYLRKHTISVLYFLHGDSYLGKIVSKRTIIVSVWSATSRLNINMSVGEFGWSEGSIATLI